MGQFERTLIIVDENVHYIEGCPSYSEDSLHSAVVGIIVRMALPLRRSELVYERIQPCIDARLPIRTRRWNGLTATWAAR